MQERTFHQTKTRVVGVQLKLIDGLDYEEME